MTGFNSKREAAADKVQEVRGFLASQLKCWHRLTGKESDELVALFEAQPAREYVPTDPFEKWWYYEGSAPPQQGEDREEHTKRMCKIAWSNGAYVAAQPAQEVDYWIREATAARQAEMALRRELEAQPAQRTWIWLSDADIAEVVDTTCQYSGGYEKYLIKKAERKIRSMNA